MNRIGLILLITGVTVLFVLQVAIIFIKVALPNIGQPPTMTIQKTPERLARGKYLAHHVAACIDCHSMRDWNKFSGPIKPGTLGMGGEKYTRDMGYPGEYYASNITPFTLNNYSDGELFHLITTGVRPDNKPIHPLMPYQNYAQTDAEDIISIIAYLRTLPSIKNELPESKTDFPMSVILNTIPRPASLKSAPSRNDSVAYGKYLVTMAACYDCHTQYSNERYVENMGFAGGRRYKLPNGRVVKSTNITPDRETGIGSLTKEEFIRKFKKYSDSSFVLPTLSESDLNTSMPWTQYAGMTREDLSSIYQFLQTLPAIKNQVVQDRKEN